MKKKKKIDKSEVLKTSEKVKKVKSEKIIKPKKPKEEKKYDYPSFTFTEKRVDVIDLTKNREWCERETKVGCVRPDIFLRNRDCDDCRLNKYCVCPIKKFSKHYKEK